MKKDRLWNSSIFISVANLITITSGVVAIQHHVGRYYEHCPQESNNEVLTVCTILFALFAIFQSNVQAVNIHTVTKWTYRLMVLWYKAINLIIYISYIALVDIMYKNIEIKRPQDEQMVYGVLYVFLFLMATIEVYKHVTKNQDTYEAEPSPVKTKKRR